MELTITKIPHLNIMVIKQKGVQFFISAPDSFLIDKTGFLELIRGATNIGFIDAQDLLNIQMDNVIGHQCICEVPTLPIGGECCELCKGYVDSKRSYK